jgi:hypothetical protein
LGSAAMAGPAARARTTRKTARILSIFLKTLLLEMDGPGDFGFFVFFVRGCGRSRELSHRALDPDPFYHRSSGLQGLSPGGCFACSSPIDVSTKRR